MAVQDDSENNAVDSSTSVVLEAELLDYSPPLVLKNPFSKSRSQKWSWRRQSDSTTKNETRSPAGVIQLIKRIPISPTTLPASEPTYWLRFVDVSVRNDRDLPLYVLLSRIAAPTLDSDRDNEGAPIRMLETRAETVLLDIGPDGQWQQAVLPCEFEQQLSVFDPLAFSSVAIVKPSAARPPSVAPIPFAYGAFVPYTPPSKSPDQLAKESEALAAALMAIDDDTHSPVSQGGEKADPLSLAALQKSARQLFRLFDTDKSNSIDFDEYKQMLAYKKINLLESKARRYFQLVDDQKKGYIDEREFVVALYITNYLKLHNSTSDKSIPSLLSPSDVFHQLDGDRDDLLNVFEYERALELLGVPCSTAKQVDRVRAHFPKSSNSITLEQFKRAWVVQIDVHEELKKRRISFSSKSKSSWIPAPLSSHQHKEMERLRDTLLHSLGEQEQQEIALALQAKAEVIEMDKQRREAEQEATRALIKQHRQVATVTRTNEAIRERQDKIRRRKERVIKDRQAKEERKLMHKMKREAERRAQLELQVARDHVASKVDELTHQKAKSGGDTINLQGRGLNEIPEGIMRGRDALNALSSVLIIDLSKNALQSLPASIFTHLFALKSLNVNENQLKTLPKEIGEACDLVMLSARSNRIHELPASGMQKLQNLKVLDLSFNQLPRFGDECEGDGLMALEDLDLSCNDPFEVLTEGIGNMKHLKRLALRANGKLARLPSSIRQLENLAFLDCSTCGQLRRIGRDVLGPSLSSLRRLDLSFSSLGSLPDAIGQIKSLQELVIRRNALISLPSSLGALRNLVALNCSYNRIEKIPKAAFTDQVLGLESIDISHNRLQMLPETVGLLASLHTLLVSHNCLSTVPLELGALVKLRRIDLSWNRLRELPEEIGCLASLKDCNLSNNHLEKLPSSIVLWENLQRLSCGGNALATPLTPSIRSLHKLEYLDLSKNALRSLEACIYELENLQVLNLSSNKLTLLPREMALASNCQQLRKLDLYGNKLSALPLEFSDRLLDQLDVLVIEMNPLTTLPEKWSAKWGMHEIYTTAFAHGYTQPEAKDWTRDCADWYPFVLETWRSFIDEQQDSREPGSDDEDLPTLAGQEFVDRVRSKMGDKWKDRFRRMVLHYYYEFRHLGHSVAFHEYIGDDKMNVEKQQVAEQRVRDKRNMRADDAIRENNEFRARVEAAYRIDDASFVVHEAKRTRRQHEIRTLRAAQQEADAVNEHLAVAVPLAKQHEAERRRREHAAFMLSLQEQTRERMKEKANKLRMRSSIKYGRIAVGEGAEEGEAARE